MFGKRIPFIKLFGFQINIDASWVLLAILISWSLAKGVFPSEYPHFSASTYWWMGIAGALGLFASILIHELSHSLIARRHGLSIKGITLFIFGGVAEMEDEPRTPGIEFRMAAIGPVTSIALGGIFYGFREIGQAFSWGDALKGVFSYLSTINLVLAVFNLVPAFPLDGGRVLRAVLWKWKGEFVKATRWASRSGSFFAAVLIALGFVSVLRGNFIGGIWQLLIGIFLKDAARMSYQQVLVQQALAGESIRRYMTTDPITIFAGTTLHDFVNNYLYRYYHKLFPVVDGARLIGCINLRDLKKFPNVEWSAHTVRELTLPCGPENAIGPDTNAKEALSLMTRTGSSRLIVAEGDRCLGIVTLKDMMKGVSLRLELEDYTQEAA